MARGRSGFTAFGAASTAGFVCAAAPAPGAEPAVLGAIATAGSGVGAAAETSMERGFPCATFTVLDSPADFGSVERVGFFSGTGWAAV